MTIHSCDLDLYHRTLKSVIIQSDRKTLLVFGNQIFPADLLQANKLMQLKYHIQDI